MMRKPFLEELEELHIQFYHMGLKVHEAVQEAVRAFLTEDLEAAKKVVSNDKEINQREQEIERFSIELIALQQPISSDLRKIVTVMKASVDLERIGDHAVSLSKAVLNLSDHSKRSAEVEEQLKKMANRLDEMLTDVLVASLKREEKKAWETAQKDARIDQLANDLHFLLIQELKNEPSKADRTACDLLAANYLERIGDYITNVAEWVVYDRTGKKPELNPHQSDRK